MNTLTKLNFANTFVQLPENFYTTLKPSGLANPYLVSASPSAAELIDLDLQELNNPDFVRYFSGNNLLPGAQPLAMVYAGHQFGRYVPRLGDGRALLLGEVRNAKGEKWDLHLKGSGPTPYSRHGDGRAVLRSCIREYLCSEALHHLGIPTSRALCVVGSDEKVYRETVEAGAMLVRLAPTHVRFGTFEYFFYTQQPQCVKQLADYVIAQHFPEVVAQPNAYALFFTAVVKKTARLIARWQAYGFAHGVMNTDNMSILGLTFDYGPYGFIDGYDAEFISNHSDHHGRYAFDQQPAIAWWNLQACAAALSDLIAREPLQEALAHYEPTLMDAYTKLLQQKLGLRETLAGDQALIAQLFELLQRSHADYTIFFRRLGNFKMNERQPALRDLFSQPHAFDGWSKLYAARLRAEGSQDASRKKRMDKINPKYILRNYLAQTAIVKAQQNDFTIVNELLKLLAHPYDEQPAYESYAALPPAWSKTIQVSCSS